MKTSAFALCLIALSTAQAAEQSHWGYSGAEGPANWGSLSPAYATCAAGKSQSPVDISHTVTADLPKLGIHYQSSGNEVVNNGHTIQVNYAPGSTLNVNGRDYELKQFHFHSPSENTIDGQSFPLEMHLVHADADGNLAVVAVMFNEGATNDTLRQIWPNMPADAMQTTKLPHPVNADTLLPEVRDYYRFSGSLTTPPCSEGVTWLVMKHHDTASRAQIDAFETAVGFSNNRPTQAVNARLILQ